jgi:hypothetical protein
MNGERLKYIAVKEYHTGEKKGGNGKNKGGIHWHLLLFNAPYVYNLKKLDDLWEKGSTNYEVIDNVGDVGQYVSKIFNYIFKEPRKILNQLKNGLYSDEKILEQKKKNQIVFEKNHKFYSASKNLKKPLVKYVFNSSSLEYLKCILAINLHTFEEHDFLDWTKSFEVLDDDTIEAFNVCGVTISRYRVPYGIEYHKILAHIMNLKEV